MKGWYEIIYVSEMSLCLLCRGWALVGVSWTVLLWEAWYRKFISWSYKVGCLSSLQSSLILPLTESWAWVTRPCAWVLNSYFWSSIYNCLCVYLSISSLVSWRSHAKKVQSQDRWGMDPWVTAWRRCSLEVAWRPHWNEAEKFRGTYWYLIKKNRSWA